MASYLHEQLNTLAALDGFRYAILVDSRTGLIMAQRSHENMLDYELLAVQATAIVRVNTETSLAIGVPDDAEEIIFTSHNEIRILCRLHSSDIDLFIFLGLHKELANLALARHQIRQMETHLKL